MLHVVRTRCCPYTQAKSSSDFRMHLASPASSVSCLTVIPCAWIWSCPFHESIYPQNTTLFISEPPAPDTFFHSRKSWVLAILSHYPWAETLRQAELLTICPDSLPSFWAAPTLLISSWRQFNSLIATPFNLAAFNNADFAYNKDSFLKIIFVYVLF